MGTMAGASYGWEILCQILRSLMMKLLLPKPTLRLTAFDRSDTSRWIRKSLFLHEKFINCNLGNCSADPLFPSSSAVGGSDRLMIDERNRDEKGPHIFLRFIVSSKSSSRNPSKGRDS